MQSEEEKAEAEVIAAAITKVRKSRKDRQSDKTKAVAKPDNEGKAKEFDVLNDPDYPPEAVNSNIIVEEIEMNGRM